MKKQKTKKTKKPTAAQVGKRIKLKEEPFFSEFSYVVAVKKGGSVKYSYPKNKKDVRAVIAGAPKGSVVEVYKAAVNFHEAWQK